MTNSKKKMAVAAMTGLMTVGSLSACMETAAKAEGNGCKANGSCKADHGCKGDHSCKGGSGCKSGGGCGS